MKPHYFNQDVPDSDDMMLEMSKRQGYVPQGCLLGGPVVFAVAGEGKDPCKGCEGPRDKCKGRMKK